MTTTAVDGRKVGLFLALAFGISWTGAIGLFLGGIDPASTLGTVLVIVVFMWAPAISAIVVQRRDGESVRAGSGLARGRLRWVALAWVAPVGLLAATIGVDLTVPGISLTTDYAAFLADFGLTTEQIDESIAILEGLPVPPIVLFVAQGLVAGLTINALAALGEVGVAGVGAALLATAVCVAHDRYVAADRITTGAPLSPWGSGD